MGANTVWIWLVVSVLAALVGAAYGHIEDASWTAGAATGFVIGALLVGFEMFIVERRVGKPLRRLPLPLFVLVTSLAWASLIAAALFVVPPLFRQPAVNDTFLQDFVFSFMVGLGFNGALRTISLVGRRVLFNFLIGRYNRPLRERRVFMFLDIKDSTFMAEQLGDLEVQSLIAEFFADIAAPIARHGGETHRYIGDEVVVTWEFDDAVRDARCIRCVFAIDAMARSRATHFLERYGFAPEYRIGMHGGSVVAGEVGDGKREIVYFGATVNTAARLCTACKQLDRHFLASDALLSHIALPTGVEVTPIGEIALAGINELIAVSEPRIDTKAASSA
ncbi:MAG: adenylate/guanylate cyclase domain-containing protein [Proteobacteria bacterium]|nr:MAG: adenylate/guanylate cyclase domain-containing protein [Pseudomonadota bacterium]